MGLTALILARGKSKRLPRKNILDFGGKALIRWTIEVAELSEIFSEIVVSTDCPIIAEEARAAGAEVPFLRPERYARDETSSLSVIRYHMEVSKLREHIMLLQPTSPLRSVSDVRDAWELYKEDMGKTSVVSATRFVSNPANVYQVIEGEGNHRKCLRLGRSAFEQPERQLYVLNGAIYIFSQTYVNRNQFLYDSNSRVFVMPHERSIDIDTELDFLDAETRLHFVGDKSIHSALRK